MISRTLYLSLATVVLLVGGTGAWLCYTGQEFLKYGLLANEPLPWDFMLPEGEEWKVPGRTGSLALIGITLFGLIGGCFVGFKAWSPDDPIDNVQAITYESEKFK